MADAETCRNCGSALPIGLPKGLCPRCTSTKPPGSSSLSACTVHTSETLAEVPGQGVLETIGATLGAVPRVLLRDTTVGESSSPIIRPTNGNETSIRYRIDGEIARGGMGAVLKGRDPDLGRDVAIKVLREDLRDNRDLVRRFVEEAQIGGQLQHPGVVPIYELGTFADQRPFFSMKLLKGQTLADLLSTRQNPAEDLPRFLSIFAAIAQTMAYAHTRGVIHRDLKPSNVMVGSFGEVQVMDWGLAKVLARGGIVADAKAGKEKPPETMIATARSGSELDLSQSGSILGTPSYMAPEQARGETQLIDERADVFALGSILCEVLTGSPAFTGRSSAAIVSKASRGETSDALARLDACAAEADLIALAKICLAVEPDDRPNDANVVSESITAYLSGVQERVQAAERERAVAVAKAIEERRRRKVQLALGASILALATLGGLSTTYYIHERAKQAAAVELVVGQAVTLRDQAQASPDDLARWQVALAAVQQAEAAGDPAAAPRLLALHTEIQGGLDAAQRDKLLVDRLVEIRSSAADDETGAATEAGYVRAFRDAGLDLASLPPAQAGAQIIGLRPSLAFALALALDDWAAVLRGKRWNPGGAARLSEVASVADPDEWRRSLRAALDLSDKAALQSLARKAKHKELGPVSLHLLGTGLFGAGDLEGAETVLRDAQRLYPQDVWVNYELGVVLEKRNRADEAIRFYTAARSIRRETAHALAHALEKRGDFDEAVAVFRDLRRARNGGPSLRETGCLTQVLAKQGKLDDILTDLRKQKLDPRARFMIPAVGSRMMQVVSVDEAIAQYPAIVAHYRFTHASGLKAQGKLVEAVAAFREAIGAEPNFGPAYAGLVLALKDQGKLDEAVAAYHEAIRLKPDDALAHFHLGGVLRAQGDYAGSLAMIRAGHLLGSKQPDWPHPSAEWVASAERQATLAGTLAVVLKGEGRPKDNAERLALALLCHESNRFATAARLTAEALETDPKLGDNLQDAHRHHAACAAALAALGQGMDDPRPDQTARDRFLAQARDWMRADLELCSKKIDASDAIDSMVVGQALQHWKECAELGILRDGVALTRLPAGEQKEWQALWARAAELEVKSDELLARLRAESAKVPVPELKAAARTSTNGASNSPAAETLAIGDDAPPISVARWVKGDPVERLASGKTYVVEFWATWCGPCRTSIPHLTALQNKHRDSGVTVIGVSVDQNQGAVVPFVKEMGDKMDYTVAVDNVPTEDTGSPKNMAQGWMEAAGEHGIPTAFIVRDRKVAWIGHPMAVDSALEKTLSKDFDLQAAARLYRQERDVMQASQIVLQSITSAAMQAWFGQEKEYTATCDRVLKLVQDVKDPATAERAAKICSLRPTDKPTRDAALVLARRAVEFGKGNPFMSHFQMALGMAEYRNGHYAEADAALLAASELGKNTPYVNVNAEFYRAMSLFKQGKKAEAQKLATEVLARMKPLPVDERYPLAVNANADDLVVWMAYKEAKALIQFTPGRRN
jgi:eukaryotic-like serine/threonine-protein kinase